MKNSNFACFILFSASLALVDGDNNDEITELRNTSADAKRAASGDVTAQTRQNMKNVFKIHLLALLIVNGLLVAPSWGINPLTTTVKEFSSLSLKNRIAVFDVDFIITLSELGRNVTDQSKRILQNRPNTINDPVAVLVLDSLIDINTREETRIGKYKLYNVFITKAISKNPNLKNQEVLNAYFDGYQTAVNDYVFNWFCQIYFSTAVWYLSPRSSALHLTETGLKSKVISDLHAPEKSLDGIMDKYLRFILPFNIHSARKNAGGLKKRKPNKVLLGSPLSPI